MINWILKFFRPHIIMMGDRYYIKKYNVAFTEYLGRERDYWWTATYAKDYCGFDTQKEAEERYREYKQTVIKIL